MATTPLDDGQFKDLVASLSRGMMQPRDQIAKIKAMAAHHTITCAQLKDLIAIVKTIQKEVIETAYASLSDKDNFASVVLAALQWQEDRDDVKKALGL